jgi:hypothetical protein
MCTSDWHRGVRGLLAGFTALELLIGLTLTVLFLLAVAPLSLSLQGVGVRETDRTVALLQGRTAAGRFERDLRLATAGGSPFGVGGPILQCTARQVVFLGHASNDRTLNVIEWEIAAEGLMRRWGPCPVTRPVMFPHSLYLDSKTMYEGIGRNAGFSYLVNGRVVVGTVPEGDLDSIEAVVLRVSGQDSSGEWPLALWTTARVGR